MNIIKTLRIRNEFARDEVVKFLKLLIINKFKRAVAFLER